MAYNYQCEIPKARVNITLDVLTHGARKRKELPMKLLMMGNFSHDNNAASLRSRDRVALHPDNFNQVMSDLAPRINLTVPNVIDSNNTDLKLSLHFNAMRDFNPEEIAKQVPKLRELIAMRNLLKDLKTSVLDNATFRKTLEKFLRHKKDRENLKHALEESAPLK